MSYALELMNESPLDDELRRLVEAAQRQPPGSRDRRKRLAELISVLQASKQLTRPQRGQFQGFYEEIYQDALQRLFTYICDRIDTYSPKRGRVLQWVNFYLSKRFFTEASRDIMPVLPAGIDARTVKRFSIDDLDIHDPNAASSQTNTLPSEEVIHYLQEDPEGLFRSTHIENHPQASFQHIALSRLNGYSWKELSTELGPGISSLSTFYQRCIKRFAPKIKIDLL